MTHENGDTERGSGPGPSLSSSTSLLRRVKVEDSEAWQRLVALYGPLVYSWCRHFGVKADDAADVLQEVFCGVHTGIATFRHDRPGDTFRGWLWTIARNKISDYFRAQVRVPSAVGGTDAQRQLAELPEMEPPPTEESAGRNRGGPGLLASLEPVRAEFEERTWQAFWRTAVEGEPTAGVAADLGMSVNAVRKAKCRVLRRLRDDLTELID